jgi:hypothetical protein
LAVAARERERQVHEASLIVAQPQELGGIADQPPRTFQLRLLGALHRRIGRRAPVPRARWYRGGARPWVNRSFGGRSAGGGSENGTTHYPAAYRHAMGTTMNVPVSGPQAYARTGGALYLIIIAVGMFGELLTRGPIIVSGDAAATASHITHSLSLWRAGIAGDILMHMCDIGVMLVFYVLLSPVSRNIALFALLSNLVQTSVLVANKLNLLIPTFLLGDAEYLKAFTPQQLHALAYVSLKTHEYGFGLGLIFFGMTCIALGYLIFRSGYLPKVLGAGMQLAGVCYLINSFVQILVPALAPRLSPAILLPPFIAELSTALWLLVKGVNLSKWQDRQNAIAGS